MFLPIIIDPFSFNDMRYHWTYLKYLYHSYEEGWPIMAQSNLSNREIQDSKRIYVCKPEFCDRNGYKILSDKQYEEVELYEIPFELIQDLIKEKGSKLAAKLFLLQNRYEPLEEIIERYIITIQEKHEEPIEGIMNWAANIESVKYLAQKYNIPIITNEFSIRFNNYESLGYFCIGDIYNPQDFKRGCDEFINNPPKIDYEYFTRKELLSMFLKGESIKYLADFDKKKGEYEMGMAGCHSFITTFMDKSFYTDLELSQDLRANYKENDILFRIHPGEEPFGATYGFKNQDESINSIEFIKKCRRIAAVGSNVVFESMLWGKPTYTNEISPFALYCSQDYTDKELQPVDEMVLNYALFCYFAPYELMFDTEYIRWRLSNPSMKALFEYHVDFYFNKYSLPKAILECRKAIRWKQFIISKGESKYISNL